MRWRLIVLGVLAVVLGIVVAVALFGAAELSSRSQRIYSAAGESVPTQKQQDEANRLIQQAGGLEQLITPLATGSLACGLAILLVLGRRWQLRAIVTDATGTAGDEPWAGR